MRSSLRRIAMLLLLTVVVGRPLLAADANPVKVECIGIRICRPVYNDDKDLKPFNWMPGMVIDVMLLPQGKTIISLDDKKSKLTKWTDSKGVDMRKKPKYSGNISNMVHYSKDRKACAATLVSPVVPAPGVVEVEGTLTVSLGSGQKDEKVKTLALKSGQKFTLGKINMEVGKLEKPSWQADKYPLAVTFKLNKPDFEQIAEIKFLNAKNKVIPSERSSMFWWGNNLSVTYNLGEKVESVGIEAKLWQNVEEVEVPLKLNTSVTW